MSQADFLLNSKEDREWCEKFGVNVTWPGRPDYPEGLTELTVRPAVLFYMGRPVWLDHDLISVVGSRTPHSQSLNWLDKELGSALKGRHCAVVSGGARGVDQKAHQIALRLEIPTLLILPSGLRRLYPALLGEYVDIILAGGGCIMSQFLPSQEMRKSFFRERNKIIAAISPATLVVECKRRSGTLLTANFARDYDRHVCVMPTFPSEAGLGGLDLICDSGATVIRDSQDLQLILNRTAKLVNTETQEQRICDPGGQIGWSFARTSK